MTLTPRGQTVKAVVLYAVAIIFLVLAIALVADALSTLLGVSNIDGG